MQQKRIAIFASGNGSNALRIIDHFKQNKEATVTLLLSNRPDAPVLEKAGNRDIPTLVVDNAGVDEGALLIAACKERSVDLVVLAGFLRKIPVAFIHAYRDRIINVHPSLLPKYGGQGMYGDKVHQAVIAAGEGETGITVHFVNEHFDQGRIIAQFHCAVFATDDLSTLRERVQRLEHTWFPIVIEKVLDSTDNQ
ncbi:MAG: phosphoribosylglycinamide formyltransferase [Bacteroidota bacterium]|jgi:phosphoribosylglycinamide formyltransferase-1